jgi:hypothetical protein
MATLELLNMKNWSQLSDLAEKPSDCEANMPDSIGDSI